MGILRILKHAQYFEKFRTNLKLNFQVQSDKYSAWMVGL